MKTFYQLVFRLALTVVILGWAWALLDLSMSFMNQPDTAWVVAGVMLDLFNLACFGLCLVGVWTKLFVTKKGEE